MIRLLRDHLFLIGKSFIGKHAKRGLVYMVCCVLVVAGLVGAAVATDPEKPIHMVVPMENRTTQEDPRLLGPALSPPPGVIETVLLCENFDTGPGGWVPLDVDLAGYPTTHFWYLDPTITPDNGAWSLSTTDPCYVISPGYGNRWRMFLEKSFSAPGGGALSGWVDVSYQIDTESGFDFFYVEVLPDNAGDWVTLHTESGLNLAGSTGMLNFGPFAGASSVTVRMRFVSDSAWSQEDGQVLTTIGRAVVIDDVTVSVSTGGAPVVTNDDFTTGEEGWTPGLVPLGPTLAMFRLEQDPDCTPVQYLLDMGITELECDHPASCPPFVGTNNAWTSTDPATGAVAEIPADYNRLFIPGIQSPVIPMAPPVGTQEYLLEFDVFSDQLFGRTKVVFQYNFAFTSGGSPCPPRFVRSSNWNSHGEAVGWNTRTYSFTHYVPAGADGIIVRLNIGDWVNIAEDLPGLGGRGRGAYFDNVRVIRLSAPPGPPILECNETVRIDAPSCDVLVPEIDINHGAIKLVLDDTTERDQLTVNQVPAAGTPATLPFDVTLSVTDLDGNTSNTCTVRFYDVNCVCDTDAPVVTCPDPITVECTDDCGTPATDPQLTAWWSSLSITDCDANPNVSHDAPSCFPLGTTTVTWTVTDANGNESQCSADVTVEDTTPPEITVELNRDCLWPPNHKMADIYAMVTVTGECCPDPTFVLTSVTSNEPDNGPADGNTVDDIQDAEIGTPDTHIRLRSERSGQGDGRIYTIVYAAEDCSGNITEATVEVRVPHNRAGGACASMGFAPGGLELDPALRQFALVIRSSDEFDATALDVTTTCVGNVEGVTKPVRSMEIDNNADGLTDLAVFYSARALSVLMDEGAIGLHYTSTAGVDYLVPNIFELGEPVPLVPEVVIPRTDDTGDDKRSTEIPEVTALLPSYPNPFNPSTTIPFSLVSQERVTLRIYSAQGKLVRILKEEILPAGMHRMIWDGRDNNSHDVATGVYFVRFNAGSFETTQKIVLIR
ncbi:MAG: T9SS type A sorting domain-containing protein [Candidatus Latescibacterota bacterium]|nr:MAG: T9SS type A sorting domain-containing protein [Candidatus Latescibacterota bacterium]